MRGRDSDTLKGARLDRALGTTKWLDMFPVVKVHHLPIFNSDHARLVIRLNDKTWVRNNGFKFQAAWLRHPDFNTKIKEHWKDAKTASENNRRIAPILLDWNKNCFVISIKGKSS